MNHNSRSSHSFIVVFITLLAISSFLLTACSATGAGTPKTYRVGIIFNRTGYDDIANGFKDKLFELGYQEGQNVSYDLQTVSETLTAQQISEKFVAEKVDLILACGTGSALAAKAAAQETSIPVIFTFSTIEGNTLVNSVQEPGGNVTGVRYPGPELTAKRFDLLHDVAPQIKRVYVAYQPDNPVVQSALEVLRPAAAEIAVSLVEVQITKAEELSADLEARAKAEDIGIDAILIMPEPISQSKAGWAAINKFAAEHKLPVAGNAVDQAQQGALFSYAPTYSDNGIQAALLANKILQGTLAGTLPVVTPEAQLLLNYEVAQQLGLTVPEGVLHLASEIIR